MAAHAYWRVRLYQFNGANAALTKVEFRAAVGGADQCVGGVAIASAVYSGSFAAAFAFNNNPDYWASPAANGEWIGYHFAAPVNVGEVVLTSRSDIAQFPGIVEIGSSDDGVTWAHEWGINPTRFNAANQTIAFPAPDRTGAHSYWRINVSANNGGANVQIGEARFRSRSGDLYGQAVNGTPDANSWFSSGFLPINAFDNDVNSGWANLAGATGILSYHFLVPVAVAELELVSPNNSSFNAQAPKDFKVQYSDDGATWFDAWSVVGSVGWAAAESRVFTRPVVLDANLSASLPVPLGVAGALQHARMLDATLPLPLGFSALLVSDGLTSVLPLPLRVAGVIETQGALAATLPLPLRVIGVLERAAALAATLPLPLRMVAAMRQRAEWVQTDFGPDIITDPFRHVRIETGIVPLDLQRDHQYANVSGVFGPFTLTWDFYTINSFTTDLDWHTGGKETFQFQAGTGVFSTIPGNIRFDKPVRGFTITCAQIDYNDNRVEVYDENDVLLGTMPFPPRPGEAGYPTTSSFDAGSNVIRRLRFVPDLSDWVCYYDFSFTYDVANTEVGGWAQTDLDPASAWSEQDTPPITVWT